MAAGEPFGIDQVVHGYARGHRELARSVELDERSRATMMVMSDLLVGRLMSDQSSYLVCYPLPAAARHVLARTWPAGPAYRPGSVWTHSLLIDYPTLAQLHDLAALTALLTPPLGEADELRGTAAVDRSDRRGRSCVQSPRGACCGEGGLLQRRTRPRSAS